MKQKVPERTRRARIVAGALVGQCIGVWALCTFTDPDKMTMAAKIGITVGFLIVWFFLNFFLWRWYDAAPKESEGSA